MIPNLLLTIVLAVGSVRANQLGWFSQMLSAQQPRPMFDTGSFNPGAGLISPSFLSEPRAVLAQQQAQKQPNQFSARFAMPPSPTTQVLRDSATGGCSINPCLNGATCLPDNSMAGFSCLCQWGFTGQRCEIGLTDCASSPCTPNKVCKARFNGGFDCLCPANRVGVNCEIHNDLCERNPCLNGGVCSAVIGGSFKCECVKPWSGVNCESMFQNPCNENALRLDEVKQFKNPWNRNSFLICTDKGKFQEMMCSVGTYFNEQINHCVPEGYEPPKCPDGYCLNDGECIVDENSLLKCVCRKGFSGDRCAVNIDECALEGNAACSGGRCVDQVNGYYCMCPSGGIGLNCQQTIRNPCTSDNIQAGNNFFELPSFNANSYVQCTSMLQFEVHKCPNNLHWHQGEKTCTLERPPIKAGICIMFPCKNGGDCVESANTAAGFTCTCKPGYTGILCEQMIDFCLSNPCQNGGKCLPYAGGYTCICQDNVIDDCCCNDVANPCPSRNAIVPGVNNYFEHSKFQHKYIHCDFDGRAFVRSCAPGTVWNQAVLTCTPEKLVIDFTSRIDQSYGNKPQTISTPVAQSSYGGYQAAAAAPVVQQQPSSYSSYQAPSNNAYGGYQQAAEATTVATTTQASTTQGYAGYQSAAPSYGGYQAPAAAQVDPSVAAPSSYGGYQQQTQDTPVPASNAYGQQSSYSSGYQQQQQQQPEQPMSITQPKPSFPSFGPTVPPQSFSSFKPVVISSSPATPFLNQMPSNKQADFFNNMPPSNIESPNSFSSFQNNFQSMPPSQNNFQSMPPSQGNFQSMPSNFQPGSFAPQGGFNNMQQQQQQPPQPNAFFKSGSAQQPENTINLVRRKIHKKN